MNSRMREHELKLKEKKEFGVPMGKVSSFKPFCLRAGRAPSSQDEPGQCSKAFSCPMSSHRLFAPVLRNRIAIIPALQIGKS